MINYKDLLDEFYKGNLDYLKGNIWFSKNQDDEPIVIQLVNDYLKVTTYQNNGWNKIHYCYDDGTTEEIYEK